MRSRRYFIQFPFKIYLTLQEKNKIMKFSLTYILFFCAYLINAQDTPPLPPSPFIYGKEFLRSDNWTTVKSNKHQKVKGTRVYFIPPTDAVQSKDIAGFESDNMIVRVFEQIGRIETQIGFFETKLLIDKGYSITDFNTKLKINGDKVAYMKGTNGSEEAIMFVTGDTNKIIFITVNFKSDAKTSKDVKSLIESFYWAKTEKENAFEYAAFEIDKDSVYLNFISGGLMYMYALKSKDASGGLMLSQAKTFYEDIPKADLERQLGRFLGEIESKGLKVELKKYGFIKLKCGLRAYEVIGETETAGKKGSSYYVMVEGKVYDFLMDFSSIISDPVIVEKNIDYYRKILDTFKAE